MEKEDVKKLQESVDLIAKTTAYILENMATKEDLNILESRLASKKDLTLTEFRLQTQIGGLETDLKSFKQEIRG